MICMNQPRFWNSMFTMTVIKAYKNKELYSDESIKKWFDEFNKPLGTQEKDIRHIKSIIRYYNAGYRLPGME